MRLRLRMMAVLAAMTKLLCLVLTGCSSMSDEEDTVERVKVGDRLPSFTVDVSDGSSYGSVFSSDKLTGETVIVFFNTSCKDCQRDLPLLNQYYLQYQHDGFQMIAISREEGNASIAKFWKENNLTIPYSAQEDRKIYNLFATSIIPRIYFCTKEGIVTRIDVEKFNFPL